MRIIIADDHRLLSESLCLVFGNDPEVEVVASVQNGNDAVLKCIELLPDLVILDIQMPELDGISAAVKIKEQCPCIKIVILTSSEEGEHIINSISSGVDAYILKDTPPDMFTYVLKCVNMGFCILSPNVSGILKNELIRQQYVSSKGKVNGLKEEYIEIISYICEGKTNREIARCMNFAEGTIKNKITKILEMVGMESRAQLVVYALEKNLF